MKYIISQLPVTNPNIFRSYDEKTDAYYRISPKDGHLIKSSKISRGNEGLQCHHICEDITPSLSDKDVASNNSIEYQAIENLCYCNLLEHLFLHILITEQSEKISVEEEKYTKMEMYQITM